jgi:hypothetical protein
MMAADETLAWLHLLERLAATLLGRAIGPADLAALCFVVREQRKLVDLVCAYLREQAAVIEALTQENAALRSVLLDQGEARPWETDDDQW